MLGQRGLVLKLAALAVFGLALFGCGADHSDKALAKRALSAKGDRATLTEVYNTAYDHCRGSGKWTLGHPAPAGTDAPDLSFEYARDNFSGDAERIIASEGCWHAWAGWKRDLTDVGVLAE